MVKICFYFQVHQPHRLKNFSIFDLGKNKNYFDDKKNKEVMEKVARKCYIPMNNLLLKLIKKYNGKFKVSFSISGTAIEQFEKYAPEVLDSFKQLAKTGCVDFLSETYYHSLSFLYSKEEFKEQVEMHQKKIKELFGVKPKIFRNTELVFSNEVAHEVEKMGFKAVLAEGAEKILGWRSPNFVYTAKGTKLKLLLKNYKLSDDIAFRFSNKGWEEHPLTAPKFGQWVHSTNGNGEVINLFMDYETFGEHQWEDTGIFNFVEQLPEEILNHPDGGFLTVSEAITMDSKDEVDFPYYVSWADTERDLTAWLGNDIQKNSIKELYDIEKFVKSTKNEELIETWRKLTTSDHFYYMCTKWFNDGDVHKYFSPYDSPYDCFISFMNVLNDLAIKLSNNQSFTDNQLINNNPDKFNEESFLPRDNPSLLLAQNQLDKFF
jgi:alpha-amylase